MESLTCYNAEKKKFIFSFLIVRVYRAFEFLNASSPALLIVRRVVPSDKRLYQRALCCSASRLDSYIYMYIYT